MTGVSQLRKSLCKGIIVGRPISRQQFSDPVEPLHPETRVSHLGEDG